MNQHVENTTIKWNSIMEVHDRLTKPMSFLSQHGKEANCIMIDSK